LRLFWRVLLKGSVHTGWAAVVLAALAAAVYGPAINRVFASDQINYFAELQGQTSLIEGLRHYDYAASRRYWKGDDALFRPLLFTWLAVGNRLFSYHHVWWNVANLTIHVLVALCLFRLLIAIRPSPFALPAAALFLVLKPPMELVLWNHLGGYMLACLFLAVGLQAFLRLATEEGDRHSPGARALYVGGFGAASLCHEAMVLTSALAAMELLVARRLTSRPDLEVGRHGRQKLPAYARQNSRELWLGSPKRSRRRQLVLIVLLPVLLFAVLYGFHSQRVARLTYIDRADTERPFELTNAVAAFPRGVSAIAQWSIELATPSATKLTPSTFDRFVKSVAFSWTSPLHLLNALLALAAVAIIGSSMSRRHLTRATPLIMLVAGAMVAYAIVVCFGRSPEEVAGVSYYPYIFGFLLVIFAYALVDFSRLAGWIAVAGGFILAAMLVLNASESAAVARESERVNHYPSLYLNRVIRFVDVHKAEPDFSFMIEPHPETLDPSVYLVEGYPGDPRSTSRRLRLTEILFALYYDRGQPKYVLDAAAEKWERRLP
jgi:hypothetical protein